MAIEVHEHLDGELIQSPARRLFPGEEVNALLHRVLDHLYSRMGDVFTSASLAEELEMTVEQVQIQLFRLFNKLNCDGDHGIYLMRIPRGKRGYQYDYSLTREKPDSSDLANGGSDLEDFLSRRQSGERSLVLRALSEMRPRKNHTLNSLSRTIGPGMEVDEVRVEIARLLSHSDRYRCATDFRVRRATDELKQDVFDIVGLDEGILQALYHDFNGSEDKNKRRALRYMGHFPGKWFALPSLKKGTAVPGKNVLRHVLDGLVRLTGIPQYRRAYGFSVEKRVDQISPAVGRVFYRVALEEGAPVKQRNYRRLTLPPRSQVSMGVQEVNMRRLYAEIEREVGIPVVPSVPRKAQHIIRRGSFVLREEKGEVEVCLKLLEEMRKGDLLSMWPFEIELDIPNNTSFGSHLERRTVQLAAELGFVVYSSVLAPSYYGIYYLDEDARKVALAKRYNESEIEAFTRDVRKFNFVEMGRRVAESLRSFRAETGVEAANELFPLWLPSQLHYDFITLVGGRQKKKEYLTLEEAVLFYKDSTGSDVSISTGRKRVMKLMMDINEGSDTTGYMMRRRRTKPPSFEMVRLAA